MSRIECPCCHGETESRSLGCCPGCGEYACDKCLSDGDGLCPECSARRAQGE